MTAPACTHVAPGFKTVRYSVVQFGFVRVTFCIRLTNALGDDFRIASLVAHVFAICTLHARLVLEQKTAEGTAHDVVDLLRDEFVAIQLGVILSLLFPCVDSLQTLFPLPDLSRCIMSVVECPIEVVDTHQKSLPGGYGQRAQAKTKLR